MANIPSPPETAMYHSDALPSFYIAKVLHSRKTRTHRVGARFFCCGGGGTWDVNRAAKCVYSKFRFNIAEREAHSASGEIRRRAKRDAFALYYGLKEG